MASLNALNGTPPRPEGFDPKCRPVLESFRCQWCLYPCAAVCESQGTASVCVWCVGERRGQRMHWCERGSHYHILEFRHYNQTDNYWDCGRCLGRSFTPDLEMPDVWIEAAPGDDLARRNGNGGPEQTGVPSVSAQCGLGDSGASVPEGPPNPN